jgi:hypothetical protein
MLAQVSRRANTGMHEQVRRSNRAARDNDLSPGQQSPFLSILHEYHASGPSVLDNDAARSGPGFDRQVCPLAAHWLQERLFRGAAPAIPDGELQGADTELLSGVEVVTVGKSESLPGGNEGFGRRSV